MVNAPPADAALGGDTPVALSGTFNVMFTAAVGACVAHRAARGTAARIEVEAATVADVAEALAIPDVDVILLDNMTLPMMAKAVALVAGRKQTEASGNVSLRTVAAIAETGVDYISVGSLTHSVQALDLSMLFR